MVVDILTTFPEAFVGPLDYSMLGRARQRGLLEVRITNIRDFAHDRHKTTDDAPYGGGSGMVMKAEPVVEAIEAVRASDPELEGPCILTSPQGELLTDAMARALAQEQGLIIVCGHYEGIDERVSQIAIHREVSIGDYVLTGGELAAMVIVDAVARFIPGVLGDPDSLCQDSFAADGLLDCPHYTRPRTYHGIQVPEVLLSGDHGAVERWRRQTAVERTARRRPDLLARARLTPDEREWVEKVTSEEG